MRRTLIVTLAALIAVLAAAGSIFVVTRNAVLGSAPGRAGVAPPRALASLPRGEALYQRTARCAACHGADGGGALLLDDPRVAVLWSPNLTRGNPDVGVRYSDADFERAIRRGLRPSGQRLLGMPSWDDAALSDADVASVIAYVRALAPVAREAPAFRLGPIGRIDMLDGRLVFDSDRIGDAPPAPNGIGTGGAYVARVAGCMRCHAAAGADAPPPLPSQQRGRAMAAIGAMPFEAFARAVLRGRDARGAAFGGHDAHAVPPALDERELRALYGYAAAAARKAATDTP